MLTYICVGGNAPHKIRPPKSRHHTQLASFQRQHIQRPLGLIIYCQPNAGLYEASALLGPMPSASPSSSSLSGDWVEFYTALGNDVLLFNYRGYGRSEGASILFWVSILLSTYAHRYHHPPTHSYMYIHIPHQQHPSN